MEFIFPFGSILFLLATGFFTLTEMVLNHFRRGMFLESEIDSMQLSKIFRYGPKLVMTLMIGKVVCDLGYIYCVIQWFLLSGKNKSLFFMGFILAMFALLLIGKLLPRLVAIKFSNFSFNLVLHLIEIMIFILWPVTVFILELRHRISRLLNLKYEDELLGNVTEEEILQMMAMGEKSGTIESQKRRMVESVMEMDETIAREVMIPRTDIEAVEINDSVDHVLDVLIKSGYTRIPVFKDNFDHIEGILYAKDLLKFINNPVAFKSEGLKALLHVPLYVPESKNILELLSEFNRFRTHIAIVVDEYGGTSGLITVEDILEEIVGDIVDEYDKPTEASIHEENPKIFIVLAHTSVYEVIEELKIDIEESEDYDTIAGFVTNKVGRIPSVGEKISVDGITYEILEGDDRRIKKIRIDMNNYKESKNDGSR